MIMFDEHPFEAQKRRRRAKFKTMHRFGRSQQAVQPTSLKAEHVVRPIEQVCAGCKQRERLGGSSLCASCLDIKIRRQNEDREFRKSLRNFAIFAAVLVVLLIVFSGWMNPSESQRTDSQTNQTQGR